MSAPMPDQVGDDLPLVQLLTPGGERLEHPEFHYDGDDESIRGLYRDLVLARRIDTEAFALQRHGEIGLWPPALGQEAAQIGSGRALRPQDFAFASYREHGVAWCRGVDPGQPARAGSVVPSTAAGTRPSTATACPASSSARRRCTPPATPWASPSTARSAPATPSATPRSSPTSATVP